MNGLIPGNLLLFGEYAVLEEDGLGISAAVYPAVSWTANEGSGITGILGNETVEYDPSDLYGNEQNRNLLYFCWQQCRSLAESTGRKLAPVEVEIDSSSFAGEGGKLGFGSSAASAAAAVTAILKNQSWHDELSPEQFIQTAYLAHASFQGNSGSGYDVYTSFSKGINLFTGGAERKAERTELRWLGYLGCFTGRKPVSSVRSVTGYSTWKKNNPGKCLEYSEKSNGLIRRLIDAGKWNEAAALIIEIRDLGQSIGKEIGVPAEFDIPEGLSASGNAVCKASGAGNELILVFSDKPVRDVSGIREIKLFGG